MEESGIMSLVPKLRQPENGRIPPREPIHPSYDAISSIWRESWVYSLQVTIAVTWLF
jgi:hypothetical protein